MSQDIVHDANRDLTDVLGVHPGPPVVTIGVADGEPRRAVVAWTQCRDWRDVGGKTTPAGLHGVFALFRATSTGRGFQLTGVVSSQLELVPERRGEEWTLTATALEPDARTVVITALYDALDDDRCRRIDDEVLCAEQVEVGVAIPVSLGHRRN